MSAQGPVLAATDLDRTLIYSRAALGLGADSTELVCVEIYDGAEASFMTAGSAAALVELAERATLVPVTTRTPAQLARVRLPGPPARFAVAANGGVIFTDGAIDRGWTAEVRRRLTGSEPLATVWKELERTCDPAWTRSLRNAEDLFCYAVIDRAAMPAAFLAETTEWAERAGWTTSLQGRKLYWVPAPLTKTAAVGEIADRTGAELVIAAGDSLLDTDLLLGADLAIMPRHGELFDTDWSAPQVVRTQHSGARAGEEIAAWLLSTASRHQAGRS